MLQPNQYTLFELINHTEQQVRISCRQLTLEIVLLKKEKQKTNRTTYFLYAELFRRFMSSQMNVIHTFSGSSTCTRVHLNESRQSELFLTELGQILNYRGALDNALIRVMSHVYRTKVLARINSLRSMLSLQIAIIPLNVLTTFFIPFQTTVHICLRAIINLCFSLSFLISFILSRMNCFSYYPLQSSNIVIFNSRS